MITVGLRLEAGEFSVRSNFEQPPVLLPTPDCSAFYPSDDALFRCCEGSAHSGIFYATREYRDRCGCIVITKLDGAALPADCGAGFAAAAALACFDALGEHQRGSEMEMEDWERG